MRSRLVLEIDPRLYSQQFVRAAYTGEPISGVGVGVTVSGVDWPFSNWKATNGRDNRCLTFLVLENKLMFIPYCTHFHLANYCSTLDFRIKTKHRSGYEALMSLLFFAPKQVLDALDICESASGRPCVFDQRSKITKMDHALKLGDQRFIAGGI